MFVHLTHNILLFRKLCELLHFSNSHKVKHLNIIPIWKNLNNQHKAFYDQSQCLKRLQTQIITHTIVRQAVGETALSITQIITSILRNQKEAIKNHLQFNPNTIKQLTAQIFLRTSMDIMTENTRKITVDMTRRKLTSNTSQFINTINLSTEVIGILIYHPNHLPLHIVHSFHLQYQRLRYKISGIDQKEWVTIKIASSISHQNARNLINFLNLMRLRLVKIDKEEKLFIKLTFFDIVSDF